MADVDWKNSVLNGDELLAGLANCTLSPAEFDHRAHICAAWHCLRSQPFDAASIRFVGLIKTYVAHLGATDKYHHTLTIALLRLIHARMRDGVDWSGFAAANNDLFSNARELLDRHYSDAQLHSAQAQREFVEPDLESLPASNLRN